MDFIPSYKGSLKVTPEQCETAHVRGCMNVSLGNASMYMSGLVPRNTRHNQAYIHHSNVDGDNKCTPSTGGVFNGPDDPKSENSNVNQVVLAQVYLTLDQEEGLMNRMQQQVLVPRLCLKLAFRNHQERTCTQFEAVASNVSGAMYSDKTQETEDIHLELSSQAFLHLQIHTDKSLAHQLYMACRHRRGSLQMSFRDFSTLGHGLSAGYNLPNSSHTTPIVVKKCQLIQAR